MTGRNAKNVENQITLKGEKERQKRIEKANAMLIPVPKSTTEKMGLISFDADGTFRLTDNRFVKVYVLNGEKEELNQETVQKNCDFAKEKQEAGSKLIGILSEPIKSKIRLTKQIPDGSLQGKCDRDFITLTAGVETYDEARKIFSDDEEKIKRMLNITPMSVNDVLNHIMSRDVDELSYASFVRGKKDWYKEMPQITDGTESFRLNDLYGESLFVLQYPDIIYENQVEKMRELGCPMIVSVELERVTTEDQVDFIRSMEKRYNRRIPDEKDFDFLNASMQLVYMCDSNDAREIIENTILSLYSKEGFIMVPALGMQKDVAQSAMTLGIIGSSNMRNVPESVIKGIIF